MKARARRIQIVMASVALAGSACGASAAQEAPAPATPVPAMASTRQHVKDAATHEVTTRRQHLAQEAVIANDEIIHAIIDLKQHNTKDAFAMLTKADGQLNILLARDPHLKMAPVDVRVNVIDLELAPDKVGKAVKDANAELDKGNIQAARQLLAPLASEMHIDTDFLPLDTYPAAIKQASAQIQAKKLKAAEATLEDALSSIVTSEDIVPLPPLVAEGDLIQAEKLLKKDKHKNKQQVIALLNGADGQLADAEALGYGSYKPIHKEIASIKDKVSGGQSKPGLFDHIKQLFRELGNDKAKAKG
jgi:YfdX protein